MLANVRPPIHSPTEDIAVGVVDRFSRTLDCYGWTSEEYRMNPEQGMEDIASFRTVSLSL